MKKRKDEGIEQDVRDELAWDDRVDAADVTGGEVTLEGAVPTYTQRSLATAGAWAITGVREVHNRLHVSLPTTVAMPADAELQRGVESTLTWNAEVESTNLTVSVEDGIVTLEGSVPAYWQMWRAAELVTGVRGVTGVENHLTVVPSRNFVDQDVAAGIEGALERNAHVDAEAVTVEVQDGAVTLTGSVPTSHAREQAYNAAVNTPGVVRVDNNVTVI
jgi:osmotically-inducible protein OsmY